MIEGKWRGVDRRVCSRVGSGLIAVLRLLVAGLVILSPVLVVPAAAGAVTDSGGEYHGYLFSYDSAALLPPTVAAQRTSGGSASLLGHALQDPQHSYDPLANFVAPSGAVDDVGQLALPRGGANLTQERLDHIVLRHWPTSGATNAGKFGPGTSLNDLTTMIDDTVRNGAFRPNTNGRPGTIFEMDLGSTIGTNINGNATSRLRVVVSPSGDVITAFPF